MAKASFGYTSDNGTTYQLSWESANEALAAGNLPAAVSLNPIYPALWTPRHFKAVPTATPSARPAQCICQAANTVYLSGPGATATIGGVAYTVTECVGEVRAD